MEEKRGSFVRLSVLDPSAAREQRIYDNSG